MVKYLNKIFLMTIIVIALAGLSFSAQAATDVCNDTVNADLTLNASISNDDGTCFNITSDNVVFDCAGFTVDGDADADGYGFYVNNETDNVTITNCNISQFNIGIFLGHGKNHTITYVNSTYNAHEGIYLLNSSFNTLTNLILSSNTQEGLQLNLTSANNTFTTLTATLNGYDGIFLQDRSENNTFTDVVSNSNTLCGINLYSNLTTITNTTTNSNNQSGVAFNASFNNVTTSTIRLNNVSGFIFENDATSRIANNTICYNTYTYTGEYAMTSEFANNTFCIDLILLPNATTSTNTSFSLEANLTNVINNTNTSCNLVFGKTTGFNNTMANNVTIQFNVTPATDMRNYWNITCLDNDGNTGTSDTWLVDTRTASGTSCENSSSCSGEYCVHDICRAAAYYCGDSYCDTAYESSSSCSEDCGGGSSSGSSSGSGAASNSVTSSFSNVADGDEITVDINRNTIPVEEIVITAAEAADSVRVVVKGYTVKPSTVSAPSNKDVYKYLDVSATIDIEEAEIKFTVPASWLSDNNVAAKDIVLMHYDVDEEEWVELSTTHISGENYKATTTSFSVFAISAKVKTAADEVKKETISEKVTAAVEDVKDIIEEPVNKINIAGIIFIAIVFVIAIYFNKEKIHKKAKHVHHKHLRRRKH